MKLNRKWLNEEFVDLSNVSDKEFVETLTVFGQKVETWERLDAEIKNVVVGKVLSMVRHPNSDHMWICQVDVGGEAPVQVIWQTGKYYEREMQAFLAAHPARHVWQGAFIDRMDYAYAAADLVVSRSGAGTVSELCLVAKPVLFVPSPNVAEDHQTKNARALETKGAAVVVADAESRTKAMPRALELLADREALAAMSRNLEALARPNAAEDIVNEIVKVMK